jgi:hypothetical protein
VKNADSADAPPMTADKAIAVFVAQDPAFIPPPPLA